MKRIYKSRLTID